MLTRRRCYPDGRMLPFDEVVGSVRRIVRVLNVPSSFDIEHGYSDGSNDPAPTDSPCTSRCILVQSPQTMRSPKDARQVFLDKAGVIIARAHCFVIKQREMQRLCCLQAAEFELDERALHPLDRLRTRRIPHHDLR